MWTKRVKSILSDQHHKRTSLFVSYNCRNYHGPWVRGIYLYEQQWYPMDPCICVKRIVFVLVDLFTENVEWPSKSICRAVGSAARVGGGHCNNAIKFIPTSTLFPHSLFPSTKEKKKLINNQQKKHSQTTAIIINKVDGIFMFEIMYIKMEIVLEKNPINSSSNSNSNRKKKLQTILLTASNNNKNHSNNCTIWSDVTMLLRLLGTYAIFEQLDILHFTQCPNYRTNPLHSPVLLGCKSTNNSSINQQHQFHPIVIPIVAPRRVSNNFGHFVWLLLASCCWLAEWLASRLDCLPAAWCKFLFC